MAPFFVRARACARADETLTRSGIASEATQSSFRHHRWFAVALQASQGRGPSVIASAAKRTSPERQTVRLVCCGPSGLAMTAAARFPVIAGRDPAIQRLCRAAAG